MAGNLWREIYGGKFMAGSTLLFSPTSFLSHFWAQRLTRYFFLQFKSIQMKGNMVTRYHISLLPLGWVHSLHFFYPPDLLQAKANTKDQTLILRRYEHERRS
jgi:hypothetical protein